MSLDRRKRGGVDALAVSVLDAMLPPCFDEASTCFSGSNEPSLHQQQ